MKKILLAGLATGLGLIAFAGSAYALSVNYVAGTTNITSAITTYTTTGADMAGMLVTAVFNDDSSETVTWASGGSGTGSGGAVGSAWFLGQSDDSFLNKWTFGEKAPDIKTLTIDAGPGRTVFDVWSSPVGTTNSALGKAFTLNSTSSWFTNYNVTYSGLITLPGASPVGDLYRYLSISFTNTQPGYGGGTFSFFADTDTTAGDINPVPEPATMLLLGTGLAGIAGTMRRRKKNI